MKPFPYFFPALIFLMLNCMTVHSQDSGVAAVRDLLGAEDEESLDSRETERFQHYLHHPLEINLVSRGRLLESGLLTPYQVATLLDYREEYGDILSFSELALVDGFGEEQVRILRPFLSLVSRSLPGSLRDGSHGLSGETLVRSGVGTPGFQYGVKNALSLGDRWASFLSARTTYEDAAFSPPSSWSGSVTYYGRRYPGKLVLGDFHARFGQGACLWSGFSLSGFSAPASFARKPSGLSASRSFSTEGVHRGVAADFAFGRFLLSGFLSFPGLLSGKGDPVRLLPGANLSWQGRSGQVALTCCGAETASVDGRFCIRGMDFFGEAAHDFRRGGWAGTGGMVLPLGNWRLSTLARYFPPMFGTEWGKGTRVWSRKQGEWGWASGLSYKGCTATLDLAGKPLDPDGKQCKIYFNMPLHITDSLVFTLRVTERVRPSEILRWRTGVRCDADLHHGGWSFRFRAEGLLCRSLGILSYLDAGRKTDLFSLYVRGTVFRIDSWDDRIYSYERDAPGNFTVPAYYGRGYSLNAYAGFRFRSHRRMLKKLKLYARAAIIRYPWMDMPKTARSEIKGQAVWSF